MWGGCGGDGGDAGDVGGCGGMWGDVGGCGEGGVSGTLWLGQSPLLREVFRQPEGSLGNSF